MTCIIQVPVLQKHLASSICEEAQLLMQTNLMLFTDAAKTVSSILRTGINILIAIEMIYREMM